MIAPSHATNGKFRKKTEGSQHSLEIHAGDIDDITSVALTVSNMPFSVLCIKDNNNYHFKSSSARLVKNNISELAVFCEEAIRSSKDFFEVRDTQGNIRFKDNLLVTEAPRMRYYAALPIFSAKGESLGVFCLLDTKPNGLNSKQKKALRAAVNIFQKTVEPLDAKQRKRPNIQHDKSVHLNELFLSTQKAAQIGVWELDLNNDHVYWSETVYDIHELAQGTPINLQDALDFYHVDFKSTLKAAMNTAITTHKLWDLELKIITAKNNERWVRAIGFPVIMDQKVKCLQGLFQDIHERKMLETKEQATQKIFEQFIEHTPAAIALFDRELNCLKASKRWYELFRISGKTTNHKKLEKILPALKDQCIRALKGEVVRRKDIAFRGFRHSKLWLNYEIYPWHDNDNNIAGIGIFCEDITAQKMLIEQVKSNESKLRSIINNSVIGTAMISKDGNFLDVNPALLNIFGYTKQELLDLAVDEISPPEDWKKDFEKMHQMMHREIECYQIEKRYYHKTGHMFWAQLNVSAVRDAWNNVMFFISQIQDITAQKEKEKERKQTHEYLETKIKERTIELEAANKELEAFNYSISHDLRSPLRGINGFGLAMKEEFEQDLPPQARKYLEKILKASARMGSLINDLLELSRISTHQLLKEPLDITEMCNETIDLFKIPVNYDLHIAPGMRAFGDRKLTKIVLENLIRNAIKYTSKQEHPKIEVTHGLADDEEIICIKDNGVGFDMAYSHKLFGVFQRLHSSSEFEGSGVGLATVQRIINKHGGKIWAESQRGEGATFYFKINGNLTT